MNGQRAVGRTPLVVILLGAAIVMAALMVVLVGSAGAQDSTDPQNRPEADLTPNNEEASSASGFVTTSLAQGKTKEDLANSLVGTGVTVSNVTYKGGNNAAGVFSGGTGIIEFDGGVVLSSGDVSFVKGPNNSGSQSGINNQPGDSQLTSLSGNTTLDAAVLEFDFVPNADKVFFSYVFGSEEYNEYVGSGFNDSFAFFVNGANCAKLDDGHGVTINHINLNSHSDLYRSNSFPSTPSPLIDTQLDGLTKALTCEASVTKNATNHIKLAIADAGDRVFDSDVLLKGGSFSTTPPTNQPPTADAGGSYTVNEGSSTNALSGSGTDPEDDAATPPLPLTYAWDVDNNGSFESSGQNPNFDATNIDGPATRQVTLRVTDSGGLTDTDTATVTVNNVRPAITSLSTLSQGALTGNQVTFTGQADDPANADDAVGFAWKWFSGNTQIGTSGPPDTGDKTSTSFPYKFTQCGEYSVSATATDKDNAESDPASLGSNPFQVYDGSFRPPIDTPATNLTLKGKVLPVKISVSCNGQPITTGLTPSIKLLNGDVTPGQEVGDDVVEAYSASAADQTGWMRPVDGGYIYNLQVPGGANVAVDQTFSVRVNPFATEDNVNPEGGAMYALLKIKK